MFKKYILFIFICVLSSLVVCAEDTPDSLLASERTQSSKTIQADFSFGAGLRRDEIKWNIASDLSGNAVPNILSELSWNDLEIYQVKTEATITLKDKYVLKGYISYGEIYGGDNQDSDYSGNHRTVEWSRSTNSGDASDVLDFSIGAGYKCYIEYLDRLFRTEDVLITFLAGYSYHEQNLVMTEGFQTIPATGPFSGLHSTYDTEWDGPWLGFEISGKKKKCTGFFRFKYHFADYYAEADWNLRSDYQHPKSFDHSADGYGFTFNMGAIYELSQQWNILLSLDIQDWIAEDGIDRTYLSSGTTAETKLNKVEWNSYALMLSALYSF